MKKTIRTEDKGPRKVTSLQKNGLEFRA